MNDRQLEYILTIAEEGNITSAAQKLYISQPSLSCLLANVEKELGAKIFDRNTSPLSLTYAGEQYVEAAKKVLGIQRELQHKIDDIQSYRKGRLSIGCGSQLSSLLFPVILPAFMKRYPHIQIKLLEENKSTVMEQMLISGKVELAVFSAKVDNKMLDSVPLYEEEVLLLTPASFTPPAATKKDGHKFPIIDMSCLNGQPFVLFKYGALRNTINKIFKDFGIHPNVILETNHWETCYRIAEEAIAFTFLPYSPLSSFLKNSWTDKVSNYSIDGDYHRRVSIYYRNNTYRPKIMEGFISLTQTILNESL